MPGTAELREWHECDVVSEDGAAVGKLADLYVDRESGEPEFLLVSSGFLGHKLHLVPAEGSSRDGNVVRVAAAKETIDSAPNVNADDDLTPDEERTLFTHYGRDYTPHPEGLLVMTRFILITRE
jgi:sporulation protein YlmC with PRC-barrel domain